MNIIDIVILGFILLYALNGMYKGFLPSLLNLGGFFLSWIGAFLFYPLLSGAFIKSDFFQSFRFYIEGAEKVNNYEIVNTPVASLSSGDIASIMEMPSFPPPITIPSCTTWKTRCSRKMALRRWASISI